MVPEPAPPPKPERAGGSKSEVESVMGLAVRINEVRETKE
jgi:hypothetical protein